MHSHRAPTLQTEKNDLNDVTSTSAHPKSGMGIKAEREALLGAATMASAIYVRS